MAVNGQFILIFLGYMAASFVAQKMATSGASTGVQYMPAWDCTQWPKR